MTALSVRNVVKTYPPTTLALDGVSLDIADGEVLALVGPPGSGKSTLLRVLAGIDQPTRGTVQVDDVDATELSPRERGVAMLFQNFALYPPLDVAANIGFPLRSLAMPAALAAVAIRVAARTVGVEHLLQRRPGELTDEQSQRVALARALVRNPRVLLLDEPVARLESRAGAELLTAIGAVVRERRATAVHVGRDHQDIPAGADRIGVLHHGRLVDIGPSERVRCRPATAVAALLVGGQHMTLLEAMVESHEGSHVVAWLDATTAFALHWDDLQARDLAHYHGDSVLVGVPAGALTLVGPTANGIGAPVLPGVVRRVVPIGRHCTAAVDVGGTGVEVDVHGVRPARTRRRDRRDTAGPSRTSETMLRSTTYAAALTVRSDISLTPHVDERVFVRIDPAQVHLFDANGRRIGAGWR